MNLQVLVRQLKLICVKRKQNVGRNEGAVRLYFFSREEPRAHVHVQHADGEAKFWIEPAVELAINHGLRARQLAEVLKLIDEHLDDIRHAWATHFPG